MKRPEVLAPAGDEQSLRAAVYAGANAVYFGIEDGFHARAKAKGISRDHLASIVDFCHQYNVKTYITFNTLIFEEELPEVEKLLITIANAGVDAIIVQDPAVALLAKEICPRLEIHASTQMTISSALSAEFAKDIGVKRVVVPRELSVDQIKKFAQESDLELEVFIHGALCMSWSGQCLTSEAWGGRSANRGQCAQSCRMPYDLIVDGEQRDLGEVQYLLSPKDLAGFRAVEALCEIGVSSLKIEGRYKGPAYVQQNVQAYQSWIDQVVHGEQENPQAQAQLAQQVLDLGLTYSRGFSDGFLGGSDHQNLVEGRFPKHRGVFLGEVALIEGEWVVVKKSGNGRLQTGGLGMTEDELIEYENQQSKQLEQLRIERSKTRVALPILGGDDGQSSGPAMAEIELTAGMGIVFDQGKPEEKEFGGRVAQVLDITDPQARKKGHFLKFRLYKQSRYSPYLLGSKLWVNSSPELERLGEKAAEQVPEGRIRVDLKIQGQIDQPLSLTLTCEDRKLCAQVQSTTHLQMAKQGGMDEALIRSKLTLGGSPFFLGSIDWHLAMGCFLPLTELKQLKRTLIDQLFIQLKAYHQVPILKTTAIAELDQTLKAQTQIEIKPLIETKTQLVPLCRTMDQLDAVIELGFKEVELDWMEFIGLSKAVDKARQFGLKVVIATVRVQKPGEEGYDHRIAKLAPDGVLIRHWGGLMHFSQLLKDQNAIQVPELHGDFSLNLSNHLSAQLVLNYGLKTITVSHDLDQIQLKGMMKALDPQRLAVTIHHHISTFHTEHCVYAHTLSKGRDFRSCGRPCESHQVGLRDHKGLIHPVVVDVECRNTVFNASAQSAASLTQDLIKSKVNRLRVEFVWENREQTTRTLDAYLALMAQKISAEQLIKRVEVHEQFGVSAGTMQVLRNV
jgi:putative protease